MFTLFTKSTNLCSKFAFEFQVGYLLVIDQGLSFIHIPFVHRVQWQAREGLVLPGSALHDELLVLEKYFYIFI